MAACGTATIARVRYLARCGAFQASRAFCTGSTSRASVAVVSTMVVHYSDYFVSMCDISFLLHLLSPAVSINENQSLIAINIFNINQ